MLALILGLAGGGLLFYLLCRITKGTVSGGGLPIGALLAFLFTPMAVLLIVAFTEPVDLLMAATAMAGMLLLCAVLRLLFTKKK